MKALIGKKIGMTRIHSEDGTSKVVTVLDVSDNYISRYIKNGNDATHLEIGKDAKKNSKKADLGNYKEINKVPKKTFRLKLESEQSLEEVGKPLNADIFETGEVVDVKGVTKGKGFQGVMKRWGFRGGKRTHGQSDRERAPGSIGSGTTPGRILKGKKMAGRTGRFNATIQNLNIVDVVSEDNLILVSGAVPGFNGSYVVIYKK